jgi:hypothetical protein
MRPVASYPAEAVFCLEVAATKRKDDRPQPRALCVYIPGFRFTLPRLRWLPSWSKVRLTLWPLAKVHARIAPSLTQVSWPLGATRVYGALFGGSDRLTGEGYIFDTHQKFGFHTN